MKATIKGELVKEYLEKFGNTASLTLAKKIKEETGLVFDTIEQIRSLIRTYRGAHGDECREKISCKRFFRDQSVQSKENPYDIPESDALVYYPFVIPKAQNRILVVPDAHIPYHCVDTMTATINWGKDHDINTVLMLGDWLDCHLLSDFVKDPNKKRFKEEREIFWKVLDRWQDAFPNAVFYYLLSNHERRYERYMMVHAPQIFDTEEYRIDITLRLGERSIISIMDKLKIRAGKLTLIHGDEYYGGGANVVSPARWLWLKARANAMCGHFHKSSFHPAVNINEEMMGCWSVGTQSNLHPEFNPNNDWQNGFARVIIEPNGDFKVTNLMILNGKVQ